MSGHLNIIILTFGFWIGLAELISGQTRDMICEPLSIVNGVGLCTSLIGLTQRCCQWDKLEGTFLTECCLSGQCEPDSEGDEYDVETCTLPECYDMKSGDKCNEDTYRNKNNNKFPAGASDVGECCKIENGKITKRECCIIVTDTPICEHYTDDC